MEHKLITVQSQEQKQGTKGKYAVITDTEGNKFYDFLPETFALLQPGCQANIGWEQSGTYKHIKNLQGNPAVVTPSVATPPAVAPEPLQAKTTPVAVPAVANSREASIEAQVAFKGLVELEVAGKMDAKSKLAMIAWAMDKLG